VIPDQVRSWAQQHLNRPIVGIIPLAGGLTESISAVQFANGPAVILRYRHDDAWTTLGATHIPAESLATSLLRGRGLPVPELLAADPTGASAGRPANLTTWRPGAIRLDPLNDTAVAELARAAVGIHATDVPADLRPAPYALWGPPRPIVPDWAEDQKLWNKALDLVAGAPPPTAHGLIHRDFHPGNLLWIGDRLTGVIDWTESSWGPADFDVAHCGNNLAMLHGLEHAGRFRRAYLAAGGVLDTDPQAVGYWQVADLIGFLPSPEHEIRALTSSSTRPPPPVVHDRTEALLAQAMRHVSPLTT
jgi:Ser/Thr protein kinase RdoA (MazF antagonist)